MDYLYIYNRYHGLYRYKIIRETPNFYILESCRINKKIMRGFNGIHYLEETEELKQQYIKEQNDKIIKRDYERLVDKLKDCKLPEIMDKRKQLLIDALNIS
jgi:hypothetical protein